MWKKICNSQQSISSYTEKTFLCLRTWNSARIKTSSYLRSMLVFAEIKIRFSELSVTFTFVSTTRSWSLSYSNMAIFLTCKVRILASCSNLGIRHDSENAKFWPRALQMQKLAMLLPLTLKSKAVFFKSFTKTDWVGLRLLRLLSLH